MRLPLWWRKQENELEEELRAHLNAAIRERMERGESRRDAEAAAHREFGNVNLVRETTRDAWGWTWLDHLAQDVRYGFRQLRGAPGFTLVAVLTLALGIGANAALFSVVDAVLLRTLPVSAPEALVLFEYRAGLSFRISGMSGTSFVSDDPRIQTDSLFRFEVFEKMQQAHLAASNSPLSDLFAFAPLPDVNAVMGQQAEIINGQAVTGGYYSGLGVQPFLGRAIIGEDDQAGAAPVVVLSYQYWQERFNANPSAIGQPLKLNQQTFTIIGVTPPAFVGTLQVDYRPAFTIPLGSEPLLQGENSNLGKAKEPGVWWLDVMGRLKPGATLEQARESLDGAFQTAALEVMPPPRKATEPAQLDPQDYPHLMAESGSRGMLDMRREYAPTIHGLFIVVALVLLIACANFANLLLARAGSRGPEITVRLAVGAGRWRLIRQLLTESLMLATLGGAVGVLFALWGNNALAALTATDTSFLPGDVGLSINWRVLAFTLVVSLLTGVLFGLAPAWRATRLDLAATLKQSCRATGAVSRLSKGLIIAQVALSLLLLVGAGLFLRTLDNLQRVNLGFNQERLLVFKLQPEQGGYKGDRLLQFYQQIFARLDNVAGVRAATFGRVPLIANHNWFNGILLPGEDAQTAAARSTARQTVRENYFATLEIPLLRGRGFTPQDDAHAPQVAIVNQAFARQFFPDAEVLGQRITSRRAGRAVEIVGVVADTKYRAQRENIKPLLYTPWQQEGAVIGEMHFTLRTVGEPTMLAATVRQVVHELDSNLPVTEIGSQVARSQATLGGERLSARLLSFFAGLALLLAAVGLSGILAYSVSQRTNEIGIRMALGEQPAGVLRLVIVQGMKLVLLGLAVGAASGYGLKRWLDHQSFELWTWQARMAKQLYGVSVNDPLTVIVIALLLLTVALLACWIPARLATRVDPLVALRHQ